MKNFIWDFDGMLVDSYPHIAAAFDKMMRETGRQIDRAFAQSLFEISFAEAFAYYGTTPEEHKRFSSMEHDYALEPVAKPFPHTLAALQGVVDAGGRNFLYTHRGESVYHYLKTYGMEPLFSFFVTSEDGIPAKPAPDAVEYIVRENGLDKRETVMIGDREIDVMAGKNAGVFGCLYTRAPRETAADFVVGDIIETLALLEK